jgi:hypothetical protein
MALSQASIFSSDSYVPAGGYETPDPLTTSVGRTQLSPPVDTIQSANTSTATTVDQKPGAGMSNTDKASIAKGAVKSAVVAVKFGIDLNNARSAYRSTTAEIQNNLMLSRINEDDTYFRGRQAMLERTNQGNLASKQAMSHLAAQGLDVNSPGAQNVIRSYQAIGIYNAAREEQNMYREAFKFDVEQAQLGYAQDMAEINLETAQFNAGLEFVMGQAEAASLAYPAFSS